MREIGRSLKAGSFLLVRTRRDRRRYFEGVADSKSAR